MIWSARRQPPMSPSTPARGRLPRFLRDLAGLLLLFAIGSSVAAAKASPGEASRGEDVAPELARLAFERFKALEGSWQGESTAGWRETITVRVIAQGSAVLFTSFDAHPGETMVTLVSLDGDRLRLTHYCVAGNQPRLEAKRVSADGRHVEMAFVDGGNLPSRDRGHMDSVVYELGDDRYASRWTWFQDGEARWMEQIENRRADPDAPSDRTSGVE